MQKRTKVRRRKVLLSLAGLAIIAATGVSAATANAARPTAPKPTIVLEHGAWADGSSWDGVVLRLQNAGYTVDVPPNPLRGPASDSAYLASYLATITGPSGAVAFTSDFIKGVGYAFFPAAAGSYTATYVADTTLPTVISTTPVNGSTLTPSAAITATFSKVMNPATINTGDFILRSPATEANPNGLLVPATVTYAPPTATLVPNSSARPK